MDRGAPSSAAPPAPRATPPANFDMGSFVSDYQKHVTDYENQKIQRCRFQRAYLPAVLGSTAVLVSGYMRWKTISRQRGLLVVLGSTSFVYFQSFKCFLNSVLDPDPNAVGAAHFRQHMKQTMPGHQFVRMFEAKHGPIPMGGPQFVKPADQQGDSMGQNISFDQDSGFSSREQHASFSPQSQPTFSPPSSSSGKPVRYNKWGDPIEEGDSE